MQPNKENNKLKSMKCLCLKKMDKEIRRNSWQPRRNNLHLNLVADLTSEVSYYLLEYILYSIKKK